MPVPAPPPTSGPSRPGPPRPGPTADAPVQPQPDALDEVRSRLAELDDRPLQEHPEQFAAIDRLLRLALEGSGSGVSGSAEAGRAEPDRAGSR